MTVQFILNPRSGPQAGRRDLSPILEPYLSSEVSFAMTERGGHATELAREAVARGATRVVAVGGDGTVNEVAQSLVGTPALLGIVPRGSGNGLARHLGIPLDPVKAIELALNPSAGVRRIDSGTANGRPFFNVMGLGLDAEISDHFSRSHKRGLPVYIWTSLKAFFRARPENVTVTCDGHREDFRVLLMVVANSEQYGNGAKIAPGARVDDGRFDLIAVERPHLLRAATLGIRLFAGTFDESPVVHRRVSSAFLIERKAPGLIHVDGEALTASDRIEVALKPASLSAIVPV